MNSPLPEARSNDGAKQGVNLSTARLLPPPFPAYKLTETDEGRRLEPGVKVGFVGLGTMGVPMANHLADAGVDLGVFNRSTGPLAPFAARGIETSTSVADLVTRSSVLFSCVTNGEALRSLFFGSEEVMRALSAKGEDLLIVDHSTISPSEAQELAGRFAQYKVRFIDAPVTGGESGAKKGTLAFMLGGDASDVNVVAPYLFRMGNRAYHFGPVGFGQRMKAVNQAVTAIHHVALAEGLALAEHGGLSTELAVELLAGGAAGSWAVATNGPKLLKGDLNPGFRARDQLKDLGFALGLGEQLGLKLPATELTRELFQRMESLGMGELGNHAVKKLYDS